MNIVGVLLIFAALIAAWVFGIMCSIRMIRKHYPATYCVLRAEIEEESEEEEEQT